MYIRFVLNVIAHTVVTMSKYLKFFAQNIVVKQHEKRMFFCHPYHETIHILSSFFLVLKLVNKRQIAYTSFVISKFPCHNSTCL